MTEAKLLEQESVVTTEHVDGRFRTRERRDRVSLGKHYRGGQVKGERVVLGVDCTRHVSNDENWGLEVRTCVCGESLDGTNGPFKRNVTEVIVVVVRTRPPKMNPHARTTCLRWFRLDSGFLSKKNRRERVVENLTCRRDLSGDSHDIIKQVLDRRIVITEVIRSSDGRLRIRSQGCLVQGGIVDRDVL